MHTPASNPRSLRDATTWRSRQDLMSLWGDRFDFIEDAALRASWERCAHLHGMADQVPFCSLPSDRVAVSMERNRDLVDAFHKSVHPLEGQLLQAALHPVLTDAKAMILAHQGDTRTFTSAQRKAVQTGTDMSERAIGTAGMNCALIAHRPVQVLAGEHYLLSNAGFQCAAAPVFAPDGHIAGAVNLTRFLTGRMFGALALAKEIARKIELNLLHQLPGQVILLELSGMAGLSIGHDGEVLGLTKVAREMLGFTGWHEKPSHFDEIFNLPFPNALDQLNRANSAKLQLISGLSLECALPSNSPKAISAKSEILNKDALLLSDVEEQTIAKALKRTGGNVAKTAQQLGISRSTLQRRIHERGSLARALREARN